MYELVIMRLQFAPCLQLVALPLFSLFRVTPGHPALLTFSFFLPWVSQWLRQLLSSHYLSRKFRLSFLFVFIQLSLFRRLLLEIHAFLCLSKEHTACFIPNHISAASSYCSICLLSTFHMCKVRSHAHKVILAECDIITIFFILRKKTFLFSYCEQPSGVSQS